MKQYESAFDMLDLSKEDTEKLKLKSVMFDYVYDKFKSMNSEVLARHFTEQYIYFVSICAFSELTVGELTRLISVIEEEKL